MTKERRRKQRGYVLVAAGAGTIALIGIVGLATDLGRMYIVKNEAQSFADSAAIDAVLELDGTGDGVTRAAGAARNNANRWNFGASTFTGVTTEFAQAAGGPWVANPIPADGYTFARVRVNPSVPLYFIPILSRSFFGTAYGGAVAGQIPKYRFAEGLFPFSPFAQGNSAPDYGLIPGVRYTLRWAANPKIDVNTCPGDNKENWIALAQAGGGDERGFIENTSSSIIRQTIIADYQSVVRQVGDAVNMTGGAKQAQRDAIVERVSQDTDPSSPTYAEYVASGRGNGRRLIACPLNTGYQYYTVVSIGAFLLLPGSEYDPGGNRPFCAEYIGAWVQGSIRRGAGAPGAYVARLAQ